MFPRSRFLSTPLLLLAAAGVHAQMPAHEWSASFGDDEYDLVHDLAVDASGNAVVVGSFLDSLDFGGGPLVSQGTSYDMFVAGFDAAGNHVWSRRFGRNDNSSTGANAAAVDASGNVYVTGVMTGTVDFGGGALSYAGLSDAFLVKFDSGGSHQWSRSFGTAAGNQRGRGLACDGAGNVVLAVDFTDSIDFGGGMLVGSGSTDIALARFDPAGNHLWSRSFGDGEIQQATDLATDSLGNILLTGQFRGAIDFGGGAIPSANPGSFDVLLAKFDPAGNHLWSDGFGDGFSQWGKGVAVDPSDNVLLAGWFESTVDFGGGTLTSAGSYDMLLAKFDASGNHLWSSSFGGPGLQRAYDVGADPLGNVVLVGFGRDSVDFGGGAVVSAGQNDVFLAGFGPAGNHRWSARFGDNLTQYGYDVGFSAAGNLYVAGGLESGIDLGGGPLPGYPGGENVYLARFAAAEPTGTPDFRGTGWGLGSPHPNPFRPSTAIPFVLRTPGPVEIVVRDVAGRHVTTLLHGHRPAGSHAVTWDGRDDSGRRVAAGIYFVRLSGSDGVRAAKLTLLD